MNDEFHIHENILRAEQISEKNREILKSEIKFCEKNKQFIESQKQSIIKDPGLLLSQISENLNEDAPSFHNSILHEEKTNEPENNNKNNNKYNENQIKSLMEIVRYDYIPSFNNGAEWNSLSQHLSLSVRESSESNNNGKEKNLKLPLQIFENEDEKGENFAKNKEKEKENLEQKKNIRLSYLLPKQDLKKIEGYLRKESPSIFQGWQVKTKIWLEG